MNISLSQLERDILFEAHGRKCDKCGATGKRLVAHHTDYGKKPDMVLCSSCHVIIHQQPDAPSRAVLQEGMLSVRGLPTWAADAIRARADKYGQSYAAVVRIILTDWAMRETAQPAAAPTEA